MFSVFDDFLRAFSNATSTFLLPCLCFFVEIGGNFVANESAATKLFLHHFLIFDKHISFYNCLWFLLKFTKKFQSNQQQKIILVNHYFGSILKLCFLPVFLTNGPDFVNRPVSCHPIESAPKVRVVVGNPGPTYNKQKFLVQSATSPQYLVQSAMYYIFFLNYGSSLR